MAKNLNFYFDNNGVPRARGKQSEKLLMSFLETDVQGSEYICHDLMNDITAIEDESVESQEFIGNAHCVTITAKGVTIASNIDDSEPEGEYTTSLKHFQEILADWEAFILDEQDPLDDSMHV